MDVNTLAPLAISIDTIKKLKPNNFVTTLYNFEIISFGMDCPFCGTELSMIYDVEESVVKDIKDYCESCKKYFKFTKVENLVIVEAKDSDE